MEIPFTFHRYDGVVPPFVGVAVKITGLPAHTGFKEGVIFTETGNNGSTTIVIEFDVAGLLEVHTTIDEVSIHITTSPLLGE